MTGPHSRRPCPVTGLVSLSLSRQLSRAACRPRRGVGGASFDALTRGLRRGLVREWSSNENA